MRVLGVEGTAWAASAAVFETETSVSEARRTAVRSDGVHDADRDELFVETDPYQPESGGIHPREAAEHMSEAIPAVVETALHAADGPIDAVAFSRGPGLGPCLRTVGTAARALAQTLDVPLVGVNHMVAHLEIGRHESGFASPVCLNASGANAHLLGFHNGRYQVLGETMDTGVGNALDKFTRHVGWSHPGGPKVEAAAKDGEYVDLPYVVKGMDFSFSGIMSAAKQAYDDGVPVEDVCYSLQENVFAMLIEVAERALSLTGSDELVLGGGVGRNERLREMLAEMCAARGAEFYAPDPELLGDNAGMIAVLGAKMAAAGDTLAVEESRVDPDFRPDQVPVTWRSGESVAVGRRDEREVQGAEATVTFEGDRVVKRRLPKPFRHPALDERLRTERTALEARLTSEARRHGVPTPVVLDVDRANAELTMEFVGEADLQDAFDERAVRDVGRHLATIHDAGFVHGDPTTRNVRCAGIDDSRNERTGDARERSAEPRSATSASGPAAREQAADRTYLIDFGLGYYTDDVEDYAMDLHVFEQSLRGTADDPETLRAAFEDAYAAAGDEAVLAQLREVEGRGRYQQHPEQ